VAQEKVIFDDELDLCRREMRDHHISEIISAVAEGPLQGVEMCLNWDTSLLIGLSSSVKRSSTCFCTASQ
jgi:hypothetical protein